METLRLPGVVFETPNPAPEEALPRMDVAAFVGFAASGPLHVPVLVESPRRFRDLFGDDPPLAWDDERGEVRRGHLGSTVDAFFSNGGLRCWVVRVADRGTAVRHVFRVPGLIDAEARSASPLVLAIARARAAGSWCEPLAVGTTIARDPLPLLADAGGEAFTIVSTSPAEPFRYRLDLATNRSQLQPGDLLEVVLGLGSLVLLVFVDRVTPVRGGVRVEGGRVDLITGDSDGAFWVRPPALGLPTAENEDPETRPPDALVEADGLLAAADALALSPPVPAIVRRLSFELLIWKGTELQMTLSNLAFGSRHPRFWAALPEDEALFTPRATDRLLDEPVGLLRDVMSPRFPLAGPEGVPPRYYLPWGMGRLRRADLALGLDPPAGGSFALDRDGLARFDARLFVDEHLAPFGAGAVLSEGEYRQYVADPPASGPRLAGLHSLLPIEEASLIAVPDAVHRGWSRELPPQPQPLGAPELDPIPPADGAGRYRLTWTAVLDADGYRLQRDVDPAFPNPQLAAETIVDPESNDDPLAAAVTLPPGCPRETFFRVRAFRDGDVGPWSNTRGMWLPVEDFATCENNRPPDLVLDFTGDNASPGPALTWRTDDPLASLPSTSQIEEAADSGFATAVDFAPEGMAIGIAPLARQRFAPRYYRIRGRAGELYGTWSNTVRVDATERAAFTEPAPNGYDATVLLAVHRALLRFCAARGDLLAVLSLPDHYRSAEALEHVGRLTPGGPELEPAPPPVSPPVLRIPPLTEGETPVLSYGALYHPWIVARASRPADAVIRSLPPDGALAGLMAATALTLGAWRAPANRPLVGVVALAPRIGIALWGRLVRGGVNLLLNDARGFLTKSEDTLGGDGALTRVHVRRLMILLRRLALREGQRLVFEPHGVLLRRRVRFMFERLLGDLFQRGAFAGRDRDEAFRVVSDDTVNTPSSVERGRLIVELRVAPAAALTFLTVRLITAGPGQLTVEEG